MSRPRRYENRAQSAFRCPRELLDEAHRSAAERDISFNLWLEQAIRSYLARLGSPTHEGTPTPPWSWDSERG